MGETREWCLFPWRTKSVRPFRAISKWAHRPCLPAHAKESSVKENRGSTTLGVAASDEPCCWEPMRCHSLFLSFIRLCSKAGHGPVYCGDENDRGSLTQKTMDHERHETTRKHQRFPPLDGSRISRVSWSVTYSTIDTDIPVDFIDQTRPNTAR